MNARSMYSESGRPQCVKDDRDHPGLVTVTVRDEAEHQPAGEKKQHGIEEPPQLGGEPHDLRQRGDRKGVDLESCFDEPGGLRRARRSADTAD